MIDLDPNPDHILITIDPTIQPRVGGIDTDLVRALEEVVDELPPLSVVELNGGLVLIDGWHRLAALQNQGRTQLAVIVLDVPVDDDVHRLAFELNASNGRPLSLDDRCAEAERELLATPTLSDREIGRRYGLSQPTVAKIRTGLESTALIEQTKNRAGKGGYRYEVRPSAALDEAVAPAISGAQRRLAVADSVHVGAMIGAKRRRASREGNVMAGQPSDVRRNNAPIPPGLGA